MKPIVSIVVPVYNAEPYLRKCLDSVIGQSFAEFEAILVMMVRWIAQERYVMSMLAKTKDLLSYIRKIREYRQQEIAELNRQRESI